MARVKKTLMNVTTIQTNDATGEVIVQGKRADGTEVPATPRQGYTIRTVDAIPTGPGTLLWQAGALVRVPVVPPVPPLNRCQLRLWLLTMAITDEQVETQIAAIPDATVRAQARIQWEDAPVYRHDNPLVLQIGAALGLTQAQIDAGFRAAAVL